jgi:uncharacterized membrane protein YoaK (UPF0700 family)
MSNTALILVSILLTWIAGFVDAVGFIALGRVYTANMSGNSIAVGIHMFRHDWAEALMRFWPVLTYVGGLLFCRLLLEISARRRFRRVATATLSLEIFLLAWVCFGNPTSPVATAPAALYIGLLAVAMGIQNGTLTHFNFVTVHTGFVTGTLVKMVEELVRYIAWLWDATDGGRRRILRELRSSSRQKSFERTVLLAVIWVAYVAGALSDAFGNSLSGVRALIIPISSLALVICLDLRRPLAECEEQAQHEGAADSTE